MFLVDIHCFVTQSKVDVRKLWISLYNTTSSFQYLTNKSGFVVQWQNVRTLTPSMDMKIIFALRSLWTFKPTKVNPSE